MSALKLAGGDVKGLEDLIEDELNVKSVQFVADETELCEVNLKANFKTLGKKCGPKMKAVASAIAAMNGATAKWPCVIEGIEIAADDVIMTRKPKAGLVVASEGSIVVGLETALTPELVAEGLAREAVSHIQAMRKEADFEVSQRITLQIEADADVRAALEAHLDYVKNETLATEVKFAAVPDGSDVDLNGHPTKIAVAPIG